MTTSRAAKTRGKNLQVRKDNPPVLPSQTGWLLSTAGVILIAGLIVAVVGFNGNLMAAGGHLGARIWSAVSPKSVYTTPFARPPLIFGTNLALYDAQDQVVNDLASQQLLKRASVPIIRMPFRSSSGDIFEVKALRAIQYIGAIPLVIVHGPTDPNALADDRQLITLVRDVFGDATVYVEFGNEPDLENIDVQTYTASWNTVIPTLKSIAPTYKFIGPSTSSAAPAYFAAFDKSAVPRPDANSWHEYVCEPDSSDEACMANLAGWTEHIQEINDAVRAATGATVPLMITEWNLDANVDPRVTNAVFMRAWTARALQTLDDNMSNGLIAAMQYCVASNEKFNLIGPTDSLTTEGSVFFQRLAATARPVTGP